LPVNLGVRRLRRGIIEVPWEDPRCIACLFEATLTEEHVLPQALGGNLTCRFLCKQCNSDLGAKFEGFAKSDPVIQSTIGELHAVVPSLVRQLTDGQTYITKGPGGKSRGRVRGGEFVVKAERLDDGSLIQPTPLAAKTILKLLQQRNLEQPAIERALRTFEESPDNSSIQLAEDLHFVKWSIDAIEPALDGPLMNLVAPLKSAYEFLALHLNRAVYEPAPGLQAARAAIRSGFIDPEHLLVERLYGPDAKPFHGLLFEGNSPHAKVQVRLFGKLAFRVHFKTLSIGGPRFAYTHDLVTNDERIEPANNSSAAV
jgi:hypothetical protein